MLDTCNSISQRQTEKKLIRVKIFLTLQVQNPVSIDKSLTKQAKRGQLAEGRLTGAAYIHTYFICHVGQ